MGGTSNDGGCNGTPNIIGWFNSQTMMRIIGLVNQKSAPDYHRVYTPLMNMEADVFITNKLTEEHLEKGCDVLVVNRFAFYNPADDIYAWRDKYGFKLVIDIDDFWILEAGHILAPYWEVNNVSNVIIDNMIRADIVTCTHWRLAEHISVYNKNVYILPNAIPMGFEQYNIDRIYSDKVRLMWQGSITHIDDVAILRNPMKRISGDSHLSKKIQTVFGGYVPKMDDCDHMLSSFTCGLKLDTKIFNAMSSFDYFQIYNHADVCMIPLVENRFNKHKSNLKILEAAAAGLPVIVSHVDPYLDFPEHCVYYVKKQSDWYNGVKYMTSIDMTRDIFAKNLSEYCESQYNFKKINNQRADIYAGKQQGIFG
jgi:glycosyltransferase involved in cell wall biosynthesis